MTQLRYKIVKNCVHLIVIEENVGKNNNYQFYQKEIIGCYRLYLSKDLNYVVALTPTVR